MDRTVKAVVFLASAAAAGQIGVQVGHAIENNMQAVDAVHEQMINNDRGDHLPANSRWHYRDNNGALVITTDGKKLSSEFAGHACIAKAIMTENILVNQQDCKTALQTGENYNPAKTWQKDEPLILIPGVTF